MNAPEMIVLPDTQALPDVRQLAIQKVGVKDLRYPISVRTRDGEVQPTIARWAMTVGLAHDVKGTHMSRFVEALEAWEAPLDVAGARDLARAMLARLGASRAISSSPSRISSARWPRCRGSRASSTTTRPCPSPRKRAAAPT